MYHDDVAQAFRPAERRLGLREKGEIDENTAAALCYTSGTTGNPKGVLYSHRSQILHAFAVALPDVAGLSEANSLLPATPMFHVNAWSIPYTAALTGARLVLPGPRLHGAALAEVIEDQAVTIALGVPTLWVGLLRYLRASGRRLSTLKRVIVPRLTRHGYSVRTLLRAVIGIPDEKWGERPVLIVVPQPESNVSEHEILALYGARVAKWFVPVRVIFVESLPVSATGKVQKNMLRQLYAPARPHRCT